MPAAALRGPEDPAALSSGPQLFLGQASRSFYSLLSLNFLLLRFKCSVCVCARARACARARVHACASNERKLQFTSHRHVIDTVMCVSLGRIISIQASFYL